VAYVFRFMSEHEKGADIVHRTLSAPITPRRYPETRKAGVTREAIQVDALGGVHSDDALSDQRLADAIPANVVLALHRHRPASHEHNLSKHYRGELDHWGLASVTRLDELTETFQV
jgi:hypothetical protein